MVVFPKPEELDLQRWSGVELKRSTPPCPRVPLNGFRSSPFCVLPNVDDCEPGRSSCSDHLHRFAGMLDEGRSQHFMALANRRDSGFQSAHVNPPDQTRHVEDIVVIAGRIELAQ